MNAPRRYRNPGDLPAVIPVFPLTGVLLLPEDAGCRSTSSNRVISRWWIS